MNIAFNTKRKTTREKPTKPQQKIPEEGELIRDTLLLLKYEIDRVNQCIDTATDEALIDSFIYELKALNMKYQFYLTLAKQNEISSTGLVV